MESATHQAAIRALGEDAKLGDWERLRRFKDRHQGPYKTVILQKLFGVDPLTLRERLDASIPFYWNGLVYASFPGGFEIVIRACDHDRALCDIERIRNEYRRNVLYAPERVAARKLEKHDPLSNIEHYEVDADRKKGRAPTRPHGDDPTADVEAYLQTMREHSGRAYADATRRLDREVEDVRAEQAKVWALIKEYTETLKAENLARERYRAAAAAVDRARHEYRKAVVAANDAILDSPLWLCYCCLVVAMFMQYLAASVRHHHENEHGLVGTLAWSTISALAAIMLDLADLVRQPRQKQD